MKKMIAVIGTVAAVQLAFLPAAHAVDGTVTINGPVSYTHLTLPTIYSV